jgi:very-short-patch-repair endonuclease
MGKDAWDLVRRQHGVIARWQMLELGLSVQAIQHRVAKGRLYRVSRGVYAVGRPTLGQHGRWMAAVLSGGPQAVLSHGSAAVLWGVGTDPGERISITVPTWSGLRHPHLDVHRRPRLRPSDTTERYGIPVTSVVCTLIDIAPELNLHKLERAVDEADRLELIDPETLIEELSRHTGQRGVGKLRGLLGRNTFRLIDSELERRFLRLAAAAGLPTPQTGRYISGFKVDFLWPDLGLVVETDGLRYHRTPAQQARDKRRDQTHTAAGLTPLRFSHAQIRFERGHVEAILHRTIERLRVEAALARRRGAPWPDGGP